MKTILLWIHITIPLIWIECVLCALTDKELRDIKRKWDECCEKNMCIKKSCYTMEWRASNWATVRQRCQNQYPVWPFLVDLFSIQEQDDLPEFFKLLQKSPVYPKQISDSLNTVWTSGTRCPRAEKHKIVLVTRWSSSDQAFPEWLEEEINSSPGDEQDKDEFCKFLVITPSPNKMETKYDFQNQNAHHAAICEFLYPGEEDIDTSNENTTEGNSSYSSKTTSIELSSTSTMQPIKGQTMRPADAIDPTNEIEISSTLSIFTSEPTSPVKYSTSTSTTKENPFCKGKKMAGIVWPDTAAGEIANVTCPDGMTGYAYWECSKESLRFIPSKPQIQNCRHVWIKELEESIDSGTVDSLNISRNLAVLTRRQNLSHGDITALVKLSTKLLFLYAQQKEDEFDEIGMLEKPSSYNFTSSMVTSMSNILRAEINTAWEILPEMHQTKAASEILKLVTNMGSRLSCVRKTNEKLQYTVAEENIGLQTFILNDTVVDEVVFPVKDFGVEVDSFLSLPLDVDLNVFYSPCKNYKTAVGVLYNHVGDFLKDENLKISGSQVATKVISFSLTNKAESILLPKGKVVKIALQHLASQEIRNGQFRNPRCMFWNFSKQIYGEWDDSGCTLLYSNATHTICSCNHLTNFAVLFDVHNNIEEDDILTWMTYICCGASSLALVVTLICFIFIKSLHCKRSIITGNLCFSLLITNALIVFGLDRTENKDLCATIAGLLHYWILAAFSWMLVEGYHLYRMVVLVFEQGYIFRLKVYYFFAYGVPLLIVGISAGVRTSDYGGKKYCWLSTNNGLMWSFVGPASTILFANLIIFIMTLRSASTVRIKREQSNLQKIKSWARGSMSVMCLLGLTWSLGLLYMEKKLQPVSYIFTLLNGLQGTFIFLFHILFNDKVKCRSLLCLKGKEEDWKKFPPHTSSNRLHSKTSARTSINSNTCGSNTVGTENWHRQVNSNGRMQQCYNDSRFRSSSSTNRQINYRKSKAKQTVSYNGKEQSPDSNLCKVRSKSLQEGNQDNIQTRTFYIKRTHTPEPIS